MRTSPTPPQNQAHAEARLSGPHDDRFAAIVVPCSARKCASPVAKLDGRQLSPGTINDVAQEWNRALELPNVPRFRADRLYQGVAFRRAKATAEALKRPLFVLSAGLGLVHSATEIPAYELSLSPDVPSSLLARVSGNFDPSAWWSTLAKGPYSTIPGAVTTGTGRVLVALTRPYAGLFGAAFSGLPAADIARFRIFGPGIKQHLPENMQSQVMEHRREVDAVLPGMCLDAGARSLAHFTSLSELSSSGDVNADQNVYDQSLIEHCSPARVRRSRLSDPALRTHVSQMVTEGLSVTAALKHLRGGLGVACEANRFRRIYVEVSR